MFQTLITKATTQVFFKSWYFTLIVPQYDIITLWLNHISSIVNFEYFPFADLGRPGGLGRFRLPPTAPFASGLVTNRNLRKKIGRKLVILPYSLLLIGKLAKPQAGPSLKRLPGSLPNRGRLRDGTTNDGDENESNIFDNFHFLKQTKSKRKMLMRMKLMFLILSLSFSFRWNISFLARQVSKRNTAWCDLPTCWKGTKRCDFSN